MILTPSSVRPELVEARSFLKKKTALRQAQGDRWWLPALLAFTVWLVPIASAHAQSRLPEAEWANTQLPDPQQEAEAKELMESLRCLVCQGQSIADSDADMASDMRALVRRRIAAGEEPDAIREWLIERYGRWITYEPPFDAVTWPLWLLPLLLLGVGLWLARKRFRFGKKS